MTKVSPTALNNNGTLTPGPHDDTDNLINEEIARNSSKIKGSKDEEMYEGGEDEENIVEENARVENVGDKELQEENEEDHDESTDDEFDPEADDDEADQKRQKKRLMEIKDWRKEMNWFEAFFRGKLRHNDYQIIFSLFVAHSALAVMAILVSVINESVVGVTIAVPLIHYAMAAFSLSKHLSTDAKMNAFHYFFFFLSYAIQYGWGIANLFITFTRYDIDPTTPGAAGAGTYMVVYLMVIPFVTSSLSAVAKWYDDKGKFSFFLMI